MTINVVPVSVIAGLDGQPRLVVNDARGCRDERLAGGQVDAAAAACQRSTTYPLSHLQYRLAGLSELLETATNADVESVGSMPPQMSWPDDAPLGVK